MTELVRFVLVFAVLAAVFRFLESRWPAVASRRTSWGLDLAWLAFGRVVDPLVKLGVAAICFGPLVLLGLPRDRELLVAGHGPLATLPGPVQLLLVLLVADGTSALMHYLHHRIPFLWRIHAVHHSTTHLDWLAAVRVHPLNELANRAPGVLVLLVLGFDLRYIAAAAPILTLWAIGLHANLNFRGGPLRYLVATPGFHRWHHALPPEGRPYGCNFAGLFPFWDLLFGTYWLPEQPARAFGVADRVIPESFLGQLLLRSEPRKPYQPSSG